MKPVGAGKGKHCSQREIVTATMSRLVEEQHEGTRAGSLTVREPATLWFAVDKIGWME